MARVRNQQGVWYIIQQISSGKTVEVIEEENFFPKFMMEQESSLTNLTDAALAEAVSKVKNLQNEWLRTYLFPSRPEDHYFAREISFAWQEVPYENKGPRADVVYKQVL